MKKKLIKIAQIKIGKSDKLYDYFCNDLKVEEGDFVYVENINFPVFVYGTKTIKDLSESLANKSILKVVDINKNVNVYTKYEDVTKIKCDCVVNSLGTKLNVFGSICKAIVENAHSKEIDDMIKNHPTAEIFDTFVTNGGDLNCKKVIHIVMPYKSDDRFNNLLKDAFCKVIDKAIELGMKSIAIPKIGTGANGYSINDIYDALRDVTLKYQYEDGITLDIINLLFDTSASNVAKERHYATRQKVIDRIDSDGEFKKIYADGLMENARLSTPEEDDIDYSYVDEQKFKLSVDYINKLIVHKYNKKDEFFYIPDEELYPFVFAWQYGKDKKVLHNVAKSRLYSKDICKKLKTGRRAFKKIDCIRLAYLEQMNFTVFIQFMQNSGYAFSPTTKNDFDLAIFTYAYMYNGFVEGKKHFEETIIKISDYSNYIIDALDKNLL